MSKHKPPAPHEHPHHHYHAPHRSKHHHPSSNSDALARHIKELAAMGATEEDLHVVIDQHGAEMTAYDTSDTPTARDPGRGTADNPINPLDRAVAISQAYDVAEQLWRSSLRNKDIVVAGEFPPHFLEDLLADDVTVTQIHPAHEGHFGPPHFHHLASFGLRGITSLHELADANCDAVMIHGAVIGNEVRVSPLVPIVLRMFPNAEKHLLQDDHIAPHMIVRVPYQGFRHIPFSF